MTQKLANIVSFIDGPLATLLKFFFIDWCLGKVSHEIYFIAVVSNNSGVHLVDSSNFSNTKM